MIQADFKILALDIAVGGAWDHQRTIIGLCKVFRISRARTGAARPAEIGIPPPRRCLTPTLVATSNNSKPAAGRGFGTNTKYLMWNCLGANFGNQFVRAVMEP